MRTKPLRVIDGKIVDCAEDCTYNFDTHKGQHSFGCRFGTLEDLMKAKEKR